MLDTAGRDLAKAKAPLAALREELDELRADNAALQQELSEARKIDAAALQQQAESWRKRCEAKTDEMEAALLQAAQDTALDRAMEPLKFSSLAAKKDFTARARAQGFALEDGAIVGFFDFAEAYRREDPGAFMAEDEERPVFSAPVERDTGTRLNNALRGALGLGP